MRTAACILRFAGCLFAGLTAFVLGFLAFCLLVGELEKHPPAEQVAFAQGPAPEGKAASCNNYHSNADKCKCHRATTCARQRPAGEDPKCKTYCKPENCKCIDPCAS